MIRCNSIHELINETLANFGNIRVRVLVQTIHFGIVNYVNPPIYELYKRENSHYTCVQMYERKILVYSIATSDTPSYETRAILAT